METYPAEKFCIGTGAIAYRTRDSVKVVLGVIHGRTVDVISLAWPSIR